MNDSMFSKAFSFNTFTYAREHKNDARNGIMCSYLAYMLRGEGLLETDSRRVKVRAGDTFFIPRGCRYRSLWRGEDEVSWISLMFEFYPNPRGIQYPLQIIPAGSDAVNEIMSLGKIKEIDCDAVGRLYRLIGQLQPLMETENVDPRSVIVETASRYMSENPRAAAAETAKFCNVSESGLYAAFRSIGTTPIKARQGLQIDRAVQLLITTDLTIDDIAERVGFGSAAYFLKILKRVTGKTSREIREESQL